MEDTGTIIFLGGERNEAPKDSERFGKTRSGKVIGVLLVDQFGLSFRKEKTSVATPTTYGMEALRGGHDAPR